MSRPGRREFEDFVLKVEPDLRRALFAVLGETILADKTTTHFGETVAKGTLVGSGTFAVTGMASSTSQFPNGMPAPPLMAGQ